MICKANIYVFKEMSMLKKLSQSAVLSVDGSDIFSDNYKDIHNFPHTDLSCFTRLILITKQLSKVTLFE